MPKLWPWYWVTSSSGIQQHFNLSDPLQKGQSSANERFKWNKRNSFCDMIFYQQSPRSFCIRSIALPVHTHAHLRDMELGNHRACRWPNTSWLIIHDKVWPIFVKDSSVIINVKKLVGEESLFRMVGNILWNITAPREIQYASLRMLSVGKPAGHQIASEICAEKRLNTLRPGKMAHIFQTTIQMQVLDTKWCIFIQIQSTFFLQFKLRISFGSENVLAPNRW